MKSGSKGFTLIEVLIVVVIIGILAAIGVGLAGVASRKAIVVKSVIYGLITQAEALERYSLSEEEFTLWRDAVARHGDKALRVTTLQKYRQL